MSSNGEKLIKGETELPNSWDVGWIGGNYISFRTDKGVSEREVHTVVIDETEENAVEVWTVDIPEGRILMNWKDSGVQVGTGDDMIEGAEIALEYMEEYDG